MDNFFKNTIEKFSVKYYKSLVLDYVSTNTFNRIIREINHIKSSIETLVAAFEEIRVTSKNTSDNAMNINKQMDYILSSNKEIEKNISGRVSDIKVSSEKINKINQVFAEITEKSKKIKGITSNIQTIAKRTNVLAINTSIEASKAGKYGVGFSIIADEIGKLANQTGLFAKDIEKTISEFINSFNTMVEYINSFSSLIKSFEEDIVNIKNSFDKNAESINMVGNSISMITNSVSEQSQAINDGFKGLSKILESIRATSHMSEAIDNAYKEIDKILSKEKM